MVSLTTYNEISNQGLSARPKPPGKIELNNEIVIVNVTSIFFKYIMIVNKVVISMTNILIGRHPLHLPHKD